MNTKDKNRATLQKLFLNIESSYLGNLLRIKKNRPYVFTCNFKVNYQKRMDVLKLICLILYA